MDTRKRQKLTTADITTYLEKHQEELAALDQTALLSEAWEKYQDALSKEEVHREVVKEAKEKFDAVLRHDNTSIDAQAGKLLCQILRGEMEATEALGKLTSLSSTPFSSDFETSQALEKLIDWLTSPEGKRTHNWNHIFYLEECIKDNQVSPEKAEECYYKAQQHLKELKEHHPEKYEPKEKEIHQAFLKRSAILVESKEEAVFVPATPASTDSVVPPSSFTWLSPRHSKITSTAPVNYLGQSIGKIISVVDPSGIKYEIADGSRSPYIIVAFDILTLKPDYDFPDSATLVEKEIRNAYFADSEKPITFCFYKNINEEKSEEKLNQVLSLDFDDVLRNYKTKEFQHTEDFTSMLKMMEQKEKASICITARDHGELLHFPKKNAALLLETQYKGLFQKCWYTSQERTRSPKSAVGFYYLIRHPDLLPENMMLFDDDKGHIEQWTTEIKGMGFVVRPDIKSGELLRQFKEVYGQASEPESAAPPASSLSSLLGRRTP